jgi:uncharacterized membrane protein YgcG
MGVVPCPQPSRSHRRCVPCSTWATGDPAHASTPANLQEWLLNAIPLWRPCGRWRLFSRCASRGCMPPSHATDHRPRARTASAYRGRVCVCRVPRARAGAAFACRGCAPWARVPRARVPCARGGFAADGGLAADGGFTADVAALRPGGDAAQTEAAASRSEAAPGSVGGGGISVGGGAAASRWLPRCSV